MNFTFRSFLLPSLAAGIATAIACGPSTPTATGIDAACGKYYDGYAAIATRCGSGSDAFTGSRDDFIALCKATVAANGSGLTQTYLQGCADAVATTTGCSVSTLDACKTPLGKLADGSACSEGIQCASGSCPQTGSSGNGPSCGTCKPTAKENEACNTPPSNLSCGPGLHCANSVCVKEVVLAAGAACSFTGPEGYNCASGTFCNAALTPGAKGICAPYPKKGESCTAVCESPYVCTAGKCADRLDVGQTCETTSDCKTNLYCDPSSKCAAKKVVNANESCADASTTCATGLKCVNKTCITVKKNGDACSPTDVCDQFLVCSGGKCVIDDPNLCK